MILRLIKDLGKRMDKQSEKFEVLSRVRKYKEQPELKNLITKMSNTLGETKDTLNEAEEQISDLEGSSGNHYHRTEQRKKNKKKRG